MAILAPNFDRVQIIPGQETENGEIASSVSCCIDTGKVSLYFSHFKHKYDYLISDSRSVQE